MQQEILHGRYVSVSPPFAQLRHFTRLPSTPCHQRSASCNDVPIKLLAVLAAARETVEAGLEGGGEESKIKDGSQEGRMQSKRRRPKAILIVSS